MTSPTKLILSCMGKNGIWADATRYREQCWTRDLSLAMAPAAGDAAEPWRELEAECNRLADVVAASSRVSADGLAAAGDACRAASEAVPTLAGRAVLVLDASSHYRRAAEAGRPQEHEEQGHPGGEQQRRDGTTAAGSHASRSSDAVAGLGFDSLAHGESRWKSSHVMPVDVYWYRPNSWWEAFLKVVWSPADNVVVATAVPLIVAVSVVAVVAHPKVIDAGAVAMPPDETIRLQARRGGPYGVEWTLNDEVMRHAQHEHASVQHEPRYTMREGRFTKLRFVNESGRLHPMHLHGQFFRVLARNGVATDEGHWRDTVLVNPKETVDIGLVPRDVGTWALHCHIQEHHDSGMMTMVKVE